MKFARGFTLVELLITITIMVVLMTLAVFSVRSIQVNARDDERKTDMENLARGLEQYYNRGDWRVIGSDTKGSYPGTRDFMHFLGTNMCDQNGQSTAYYASNQCYVPGGYAAEVLPGITKESMVNPGGSQNFITNWWCDDACLTNSLVNTDNYIYRPFNPASSPDASGWCFHNCPRYELWYKLESTGTIVKLKSKHQ